MKNFNIDEFVIDDVLEDQKKLMKKKSKEKKKKANRSEEEVIADEIVKDKKKEEKKIRSLTEKEKRQREAEITASNEANADSRFYYWKKSLEDKYGKEVYTREEFLAYRPDQDSGRSKSDYVIVDENGDILKKKDVLSQKDKMVINISL